MRSISAVPIGLVFSWLIGFSLIGLAQPPFGLTGDAAHGGEIAAQQCVSCHGPNGNSTSSSTPRLSGQIYPYLLIQEYILKTGERPSPVMNPVAANLSDQDIADLAAFWSSQTPAGAAWEGQDPALVESGKTIFEMGNVGAGVIACSICHGAQGQGVSELGIPRIMGQSPDYLTSILGEFAQVPDFGAAAPNAMHIIASRLSADDLNAIVAYLASQPWGNP